MNLNTDKPPFSPRSSPTSSLSFNDSMSVGSSDSAIPVNVGYPVRVEYVNPCENSTVILMTLNLISFLLVCITNSFAVFGFFTSKSIMNISETYSNVLTLPYNAFIIWPVIAV